MKQQLFAAYIVGFAAFPEDYELLEPCEQATDNQLLYLAVFALQTNVSSNCLIFRSYEFLTIRKPINSQYISLGIIILTKKNYLNTF
ncbi:MAG: hypothetical protein ACI94Y_001246 [Maribacter sp.]|jgi:hypothetical protein